MPGKIEDGYNAESGSLALDRSWQVLSGCREPKRAGWVGRQVGSHRAFAEYGWLLTCKW